MKIADKVKNESDNVKAAIAGVASIFKLFRLSPDEGKRVCELIIAWVNEELE